MLPTDDKPPPDNRNGNLNRSYQINDIQRGGSIATPNMTLNARAINALQSTLASRANDHIDDIDEGDEIDDVEKTGYRHVAINGRNGSNEQFLPDSPKHNENFGNNLNAVKKSSAIYNGPGRAVVKDDSLYSIGSDASTVGSEKKHKLFNGAKHASLKR